MLAKLKYLIVVVILLLTSCSEEKLVQVECQLAKIVVSGTGYETHTDYSYDSKGRMIRQIRTNKGVVYFDYTYTYTTDGLVDKVEKTDGYTQHMYTTDGKIATINNFTLTGELRSLESYAWNSNIVEITNPYTCTS